MLTSLSIRNVVLIDKLDLDFKSGLSVLTGETGAGKSILLDSLGFVLGNRGDAGLIRQGEDKLSVTATFDLPKKKQELENIFNEYELDFPEDELIIKRTLNRDGKGKIFVNDQTVSVKVLKEIGRCLVEVHGQFDNQGLLNPANHQSVLDSFGGYKKELEGVSKAYREYKAAQKERENAEAGINKAKSDEEDLRHWVAELERAGTYTGEEAELNGKRLEMMNAEKILESLNYAYGALSGNFDIISSIRQSVSAIEKANVLVNGKYDNIVEMLSETLVNAEEAISEIEAASQNVSLNENELNSVEERLFSLRALARKHQCEVDELPQKLSEMQAALAQIEHGEDNLEKLKQAEQKAKAEYESKAQELSLKRQEAAKKLDSLVMKELPPLKMEKARFETKIEALPENSWNETGKDNVYFTVSTNPNSPQGPLNKIASGGELSRFMLALKVNLAKVSSVGTMIFDEVDAGVGGATAKAVGERLARLAEDVQVLVVTHSPQVAASGNHHFKVEKRTEKNVTTTTVKQLAFGERMEEIARMLAGEKVTEEARAAARVLLSA